MIPPITDELIAARIDERSLARGRSYAERGAVVAGQREGRVLRAACHGSRPEPYQVEVELDETGIARALCTCPIGAEGTCKHVAALLLVYRDEPEAFAQVAALDELLELHSQDELIDLVKRLVRRQPSLIDLVLHAPVPASVNGAATARAESSAANGNSRASHGGVPPGSAPQANEQAVSSDSPPGPGSEADRNLEILAALARRFLEKPSLATYKHASELATALHCWHVLQPSFEAAVAGDRYRDLRIRIHLYEGDILRALAALPPKIPLSQWAVVEEVARAAEATHPETACALYQQYVEALIQQRGRDNYRRACVYLARIRDLYREGGQSESWQQAVARLRVRHGQLPAFLDELAAARL